MILYKVFNIQKFIVRRTAQAEVTENAENEADVGIAALDGLLGAF
jgi:hypothetical protein